MSNFSPEPSSPIPPPQTRGSALNSGLGLAAWRGRVSAWPHAQMLTGHGEQMPSQSESWTADGESAPLS